MWRWHWSSSISIISSFIILEIKSQALSVVLYRICVTVYSPRCSTSEPFDDKAFRSCINQPYLVSWFFGKFDIHGNNWFTSKKLVFPTTDIHPVSYDGHIRSITWDLNYLIADRTSYWFNKMDPYALITPRISVSVVTAEHIVWHSSWYFTLWVDK